jgi:hypothetical protein
MQTRRRISRAEQGQCSVSYSADLERLLVGAPSHTALRVRHIWFDQVRARCADAGLREGDELRDVEVTPDHVSIDLERGDTVRLALILATCVEVEPSGATSGRRS